MVASTDRGRASPLPAAASAVAAGRLGRGLLQRCLYFAAAAAVAGLALALRLPNLVVPSDNYDEGVYLESLLLMRHGYRPFVDFVATQGPIYLDLAYLSYALGGYTLSAARLGAVAASLAGLLGIAWATQTLGGRFGGLVAALALALSPTYLAVSRQVVPEAPAAGLAALAVGAAAQAQRHGGDRWRLLAGALVGLACSVKPIVAPAIIPVVLFSLERRSPRGALLALGAALLVGLGALLAVGPTAVLSQVVGWRVGGRQFDLATVPHNADLLLDKMFRQEQPAFYVLAAVGAGVLFGRSRRAGLAVIAWLAAQLGLLLLYVQLSSHLGAALPAPLALLAGVGLAGGVQAVARRRRALATPILILAGLWYAASVPALLDRDQRLIAGLLSTDRDRGEAERAAVQAIATLTDADDFVLTDAPYLAFLADRTVPPRLVDPSEARIEAGALTAEDVAAALRTYNPHLVVLWTGKLARFSALWERLGAEYPLVADFGLVDDLPRAIYRDPAGD